MPELTHVSLYDGPAPWFGVHVTNASAEYCLLKLYIRHLSYFSARVAQMRPVEGTKTWLACCPFCDGAFAIDALSGWWTCAGCGQQGEAYTLEFVLFGENLPERWEDCRRQAEQLMAGPLAIPLLAESAHFQG